MPFRSRPASRWLKKIGLLTLAVAVPVAGLVVPASPAAAVAAIPCGPRTSTQPFKQWNDLAAYFTLPGGTFESTPSGWTLRGGAGLTSGNEPWKVVAGTNAKSLRLPPGSSVVAPTFCVSPSESQFRFFYKSPGISGSNLRVTVRVDFGTWVSNSEFWASGNTPGWQVSQIIALPNVADSRAQPTVTLTFLPVNSSSAVWLIDDVEVDPWKSL
jgi:hypothetical protein